MESAGVCVWQNLGIRDVGDLRMPIVRDPGGGAVGEWARGSSTTVNIGAVAIAVAFSSASMTFYLSRTGAWQYFLRLKLLRCISTNLFATGISECE